mmetsp:Transcript_41072/g.100158  ORF Transcript_41072/g.100158 Transcript_41072/m.100158 type:complete len:205 (+) Transcript_41072:478-1092(+)
MLPISLLPHHPPRPLAPRGNKRPAVCKLLPVLRVWAGLRGGDAGHPLGPYARDPPRLPRTGGVLSHGRDPHPALLEPHHHHVLLRGLLVGKDRVKRRNGHVPGIAHHHHARPASSPGWKREGDSARVGGLGGPGGGPADPGDDFARHAPRNVRSAACQGPRGGDDWAAEEGDRAVQRPAGVHCAQREDERAGGCHGDARPLVRV